MRLPTTISICLFWKKKSLLICDFTGSCVNLSWCLCVTSQLFCTNSEASPSILCPSLSVLLSPMVPWRAAHWGADSWVGRSEPCRGSQVGDAGMADSNRTVTRKWLTANIMVTLPMHHPAAGQEHTPRPLWPHSSPSAQLAAKAVPTTTCWQSRAETKKHRWTTRCSSQ